MLRTDGRKSMAACFAAVLLVLSAAPRLHGRHVMKICFTETSFLSVDPRDARVAIRVWMETLVKDYDLDFDIEAFTEKDMGAAARALEAGRYDVLAGTSIEYLDVGKVIPLLPFAIGIRGQTLGSTFLLLAKKGGGVTDLTKLKGTNIILELRGNLTLSQIWLDTLLLEAGLPPSREYFRVVRSSSKASKTVLSVFFGKLPACVATRYSYDTMVELNPQVGRELVTLARSDNIPTAIIAFRKRYYDAQTRRADILKRLSFVMHERPSGRQVLTLFRLDKLVAYREGSLDVLLALLRRHEALRKSRRGKKN